MKRAKREVKKLKGYLGRVIRDIERKMQYAAVHAPEVECIGKGKAHKKYEFGCKVLVVSTSRNNWIVGVQAHHGNPYDGHLLKSSIKNIENLTKSRPKNVFVDKGFRGKRVPSK